MIDTSRLIFGVIGFIIGAIIMIIFRVITDFTNLGLGWVHDKPHPSGKLGKSFPVLRLSELVRRFGKYDSIDRKQGGSAIWSEPTLKKRGFIWHRIELKDELIPHGDHADFLYAEYNLKVPKNKISQVRAISPSLTYDELKGIVRARCHFMGANLVTILLAKRVATGKMSLGQAQKQYTPLIGQVSKDPILYNKFLLELK